MFEVKKEDLKVKSVIDYPETNATAERFINVNGLTYYFFGDSKVECDEADKFEFAFGKELAETNATIDMLRNYKSFLIRQTKQPEWRKEKKEKKPDFKSWGEFTEYLNNLAEAFLKDFKDNTYHLKDK